MPVEIELQEKITVFAPPPEVNIFFLPETGFDIRLQMDTLPQSRSPEDIDLWLKLTREDIKHFWLEYLAKLKVLPIPIGIVNGKVVAPEYNNATLSDKTSAEERRGSVKRSVGKIEEFLVRAKPGSVALLTSPPGWSGLTNSEGLPISYPDTQTYIFYKESKNKVTGFTLINNMDLIENEELLTSFSDKKADPSLPTPERITSITDSPLFFESDGKYSFNPEGVIRAIHALLPGSFNLSQALYLLDNLDDLSHITSHQYVESLITNFEAAVRAIPKEANIPEVAANLLGLTILEISGTTRTNTAPIYYNHQNYLAPPRDYQEELRFLQAQGGCNGGGKKTGTSIIQSALGVRRTESGATGPTIFCDICKSDVSTYIKEGVIYCALCGQPVGKIAKEEKEKK